MKMSSGEETGKEKAMVDLLPHDGDNQTNINEGFEMDSMDEDDKTNNGR